MKYLISVLFLILPIFSIGQVDQLKVEIPTMVNLNSETDNVFKIKSSNLPYRIISFKVVSRWGEEIYVSTENNASWDGKEKGKYVSTGTYYYSIKLELQDERQEELKGYVTVIR